MKHLISPFIVSYMRLSVSLASIRLALGLVMFYTCQKTPEDGASFYDSVRTEFVKITKINSTRKFVGLQCKTLKIFSSPVSL